MEVLILPLKNNDVKLQADYEKAIFSTEMRLLPVTLLILREVARMRANQNLRTPDAIHAATALSTGSVSFLTNDLSFNRVSNLCPIVLDKYLPTTQNA